MLLPQRKNQILIFLYTEKKKKTHNKTTTDFFLLGSFTKKWVVICEGALTQSLGLLRLEDHMCMWMNQLVDLEKDKAEDLRYSSVI